jgi:very-short-patch-repair endonuclease
VARGPLRLTTPERTVEDLAATASVRELRRIVEEAERRLLLRRPLDTTRRAGLPRPRVGVPFRGYVLDPLWPEERLVAETDGFRDHSGREVFGTDRRRDRELTAAGLRVVRFTHADVVEHPARTGAELATLLAVRVGPPTRGVG